MQRDVCIRVGIFQGKEIMMMTARQQWVTRKCRSLSFLISSSEARIIKCMCIDTRVVFS